MFECFAGAFCDTEGRIFSEMCFDSRTSVYELGEIAQEAGAARHDDAVVDNVGGQLRRRFLQDVLHRVDDGAKFAAYRAHYLVGADLKGARQSGKVIATFDLHHELFFDRHCRADLYLHVFRRFFTDAEVVGFLDVISNGVVQGITRAFDRSRGNDAAKRNDRDVCGATADIDDHVPARLVNGNAGTYCGKYWLFDDIRFARTGFRRGLNDRPPFGGTYSCRNGDHHLGAKKIPRPERFSDVVAKHCLSHTIVGNDAILRRPVRVYLGGRAADHLFGVVADRQNLVVRGRDGHDRWLVEDDAFAGHEDQHRRRAEVYAKLGRKRECHGEPFYVFFGTRAIDQASDYFLYFSGFSSYPSTTTLRVGYGAGLIACPRLHQLRFLTLIIFIRVQ